MKLQKEAQKGASDYIEQLTGEKMPVVDEGKTRKKKLCILGTAGSHDQAPWDDPDAEFWGVAHCLLLPGIRKLDKVFEIHLPYIYEKEISPYSKKPIIYHANKENQMFGRTGDIEVIIGQEKDDNLNKVVQFPREQLKRKYSDLLPDSDQFYATNSIAWMIVWGLDKIIEENAYDEIHLYGIHLETDSEWQYERPCNEYWLGVVTGYLLAQGKRKVVYMPVESDVLRASNEYGFADIEVKRKKIKSKVDYARNEIEKMKQQRNAVINQLHKLRNEISMKIEDKIKGLENQKKVYEIELENIKRDGKEKYKEIIEKKINEQIKKCEEDLKTLESRIAAFNGSLETHQYYLKELNA
jgi:hypothetical protein